MQTSAPKMPALSAAALEQKIAQFQPVTITADIGHLPDNEKQALELLIEAARLLDPIFDRQAFSGNPDLAQTLAADQSPLGKARYQYFQIMRGPWDRQDHFAPFAVPESRPLGAGYYPDDLSEEEFRAYLDAHPDTRAALESLTTVIRRQGDELIAIPYSEEYREWLVPAAA